MRIKIFSDGAELKQFKQMNAKSYIGGFTTNPTLMRRAGIKNYTKFAQQVLEIINEKPISFEVFADDEKDMARQANIIKKWGKNVYVKIPIVNSLGSSMVHLIKNLTSEGIKINVTAILAINQIEALVASLDKKIPSIVSVFAGRIADTGRDPSPIITEAARLFSDNALAEVLWASTREVYNIWQAEASGAHIITVTPELLKKYEMMNQADLIELSRQTSEMFWSDAKKAGYQL